MAKVKCLQTSAEGSDEGTTKRTPAGLCSPPAQPAPWQRLPLAQTQNICLKHTLGHIIFSQKITNVYDLAGGEFKDPSAI